MFYGIRKENDDWKIVHIEEEKKPIRGIRWIEYTEEVDGETVPKELVNPGVVEDDQGEVSLVEDQEDFLAGELKKAWVEMDDGIIIDSAPIFKTTNRESMLAFVDDFQMRIMRPDMFISENEAAEFLTTSFAVGDLLDTEEKIKNYYSELLFDLLQKRRNRIGTFLIKKSDLGL